MTLAHNLSHAVNAYEAWLKELEEKPAIKSPDEAYAVMRAVLQTLRDRLAPEQAAHFSAQLPMIARGIFYEGWRPSRPLQKLDQQEFYDHVRERLNGACPGVDAALLTRYALEVVNHRLDPGQVKHVKATLPGDIQAIFPAQAAQQ